MNKKKCIITGSHGMLGNNLCHYLQDEFNIFAFHRDKKVLVPCYDNFSVDLTNSNEITNYIKKIKPSYIITQLD